MLYLNPAILKAIVLVSLNSAVLLFILPSCERCRHDPSSIIEGNISFSIIDEQSGSDLFTDTAYSIDSLTIFDEVNKDRVFSTTQSGNKYVINKVHVFSNSSEANDAVKAPVTKILFLRFNQADTDTIKIVCKGKSSKNGCNSTFEYITISYNDSLQYESSGNLNIVLDFHKK